MPGLGAASGKFQISTGWHFASADRSYFNSRLNHDFTRLWNPHERLSILDVTGRYNISKRLSATVTVPIVFNSFSTLLPPKGGDIVNRESWHARGLGDISLFGQSWILDPATHPFGNIAVGVGIKAPTGNWNVKANIPNENGVNVTRKAVYPAAIMPGDGGTGIIVGLEGFRTFTAMGPLRGGTVFGAASYLINPRDTNGTDSIIKSLGVPLTPPFTQRTKNSVADSYSASGGIALRVPGTWDKPKLKGLRMRVIGSIEGTTAYDLIGANRGFRTPGYSVSLGPGISYARGRDFWVVDVPFVVGRHIDPGRTALPGLPVPGPNGIQLPGRFNPNRQMGLVAPMSLSMRYVRSL